MEKEAEEPVPDGWTVVDFDENDDYEPWCSEQTPEDEDGSF